MSWWMLALVGVGGWMIWSVILSLCFSACIRSGDMRFVATSVQSNNGARRTASGLPVWIMPDCGCQRCVEKRAAARGRRDMQRADDRSMRDAFEKQED